MLCCHENAKGGFVLHLVGGCDHAFTSGPAPFCPACIGPGMKAYLLGFGMLSGAGTGGIGGIGGTGTVLQPDKATFIVAPDVETTALVQV